jgi:hypothetical protein
MVTSAEDSTRVRFSFKRFVNLVVFLSFSSSLVYRDRPKVFSFRVQIGAVRVCTNNHQSIQLFSAYRQNPRSSSNVASLGDFFGEQGCIDLISDLLVSLSLLDVLSFNYQFFAVVSSSLSTNQTSSFKSYKAASL